MNPFKPPPSILTPLVPLSLALLLWARDGGRCQWAEEGGGAGREGEMALTAPVKRSPEGAGVVMARFNVRESWDRSPSDSCGDTIFFPLPQLPPHTTTFLPRRAASLPTLPALQIP